MSSGTWLDPNNYFVVFFNYPFSSFSCLRNLILACKFLSITNLVKCFVIITVRSFDTFRTTAWEKVN